jgi:proteasome lid subunit RPN8/RPN11
MMPARLQLTADQARTLTALAEAAAPRECCGLLIGHDSAEGLIVSEIVPTANVAADPVRSFEIDPQSQFETLRRLRGSPLRMIGHYHSHPNGAAELSRHDLAMAHDPTAVWLLIPLADGRAGPLRGFVCSHSDTATAISIQIMA